MFTDRHQNSDKTREARSSHLRLAAALWIAAAVLLPSAASARPNYVSLAAFQTPIKSQGKRGTCITFSAIAALEAAYNRAGYGQLDLSEQFLNHVNKMTWLNEKWNDVARKGEDGGEGQVSAFGGGNGANFIEQFAKGMRVPGESAMPYRPKGFGPEDHPHLTYDWQSPFWTQRRMSDFNLDARFLPRSALTQPSYYSVKQYERVPATNADILEQVLASGHEVVWDFHVTNRGQGPIIWTPCSRDQANCRSSAHSMLLIGYDRRDADPARHHFIVKNSWGPTQHPDGYTRISYDYVRKQGLSAAYIVEVERPRPWPELGYIGRWNWNFGGRKGLLDIYHVPGIAQWHLDKSGIHVADRRIGAFYDENGRAYRVNGRMSGQQIEFYIDWKNPNARWDEIGGSRFVYSAPVNGTMTGFHIDAAGQKVPGVASLEPAPAPVERAAASGAVSRK